MKLIESVFMRKTHWYCSKTAENWLLIFIDIIAMASAFFLTRVFISTADHQPLNTVFIELWTQQGFKRLGIYAGLIAITIGAFWSKGHYLKRRPYWNEIKEILNIAMILALIDATLIFLGKWPTSRTLHLVNWLLVPPLIILMRDTVKYFLASVGGWNRPMVIIGCGENAIETARAFASESTMGFILVAFLIPEGKKKFEHDFKDSNDQPVPCVPLGKNPEHILKYLGNPHIVLALEEGGIDSSQELIQKLSLYYQDIQIVPSLRGLPLYGMDVNHFFSHEVLLLSVRNNLARRGPQLLKRAFDVLASLALLIAGSPILLWIAAKVFASGRPIFYGHKRVGQFGKLFSCYKFRTMLPNSDKLLEELLVRDPVAKAEWLRDFKLKKDPRITPIGQFLRKTSLDELPQLWNVLKGEMSLVGPRPIVEAELERYGNQVDYYLEAKPGITGLWQISGRNNVAYDTRVYLDTWYVKNWSLFNDIVILFKTINVLLKKDGAY